MVIPEVDTQYFGEFFGEDEGSHSQVGLNQAQEFKQL
jgi:hypothetical protein